MRTTLLLSVVLAWAAPARAADWSVGPGRELASIADAVAAAASGDRILLDAGTYAEAGILVAGKALEIVGGPGVVVQPSGDVVATRTFVVSQGELSVSDVTFDGLGSGGAFEVSTGSLELERVTVRGARADSGAAVSAWDAELDLVDCTFESNTAVEVGGDLFLGESRTTVRGGSFTGADGQDGASIAAYGGTLALSDLKISGANASYGSVIDSTAGLALDGVTVDGNVSTAATLDQYGGSLAIRSSRLERNQAGGETVHVVGAASIVIDDTDVLYNEAGGALFYLISTPVTDVTRSFFCGNTSGARSVKFSSSAGTFNNNVVMSGDAGIYGVTSYASTMRAENNTLLGNVSYSGSAFTADGGGTLDAVNNLVAHNTDATGGALWVPSGELTFSWGLLFANQPGHTSGVVTITDSLVDVDPGLAPPTGGCDPLEAMLPVDSAAVDAGDPSIPDTDGSPSDIGASGGPDPNPRVTPQEPEPEPEPEPDPEPDPVIDADTDGAEAAIDCDDTNPGVHPGATEVRDDGIDQDCDGVDLVTSLDGAVGVACGGCASSPAGASPLLLLAGMLIRRRRR